VELPNGIKIAKGEHTAVSSHRMWSAEDYQNPDEFDAFRFVERRKLPGYENRSLLVSTSFDHLGFSHGKHACPGRFFAANEVKIAMVHLLMKYDMKIEEPKMAQWMTFGTAMIANPKAKISVRRREPEVDLELLANQL
jgi:cytochrome P450